METYVSLIQSYTGRDKILRTVGYVATLLSGSVRYEETSKKLVSISRQISNSRAILRFFDDILMWRITRHLSVEVRYVLLFKWILFAIWREFGLSETDENWMDEI